jgi:hypothetical protein
MQMTKIHVPAFFALLMSAALALSGCGKPATPPVKEGDNHDEHGHVGPHKGQIIELGTGEYHAELVDDHDQHRVTVYILDKSAQKATPVEAKEVQINLVVAGRPAQFTLPAKPEDDESEATSSRFQLTDEALCDALDAPKSKGRLQITIGGETYSGEMEAHDHDHD